MLNCTIRPCTVKDCKALMQLIKVAISYKVPADQLKVNLEALREAGFGAQPLYYCYVAELPPEQKNKNGDSIVGYVLSSFTYSTWKGRNVYMDNLYVQPEFRGHKIGIRLVMNAARMALSEGSSQLRMHVGNCKEKEKSFLSWLGAEDLTAKEGWNLFRFEEDALQRLAAGSKVQGDGGNLAGLGHQEGKDENGPSQTGH